MASVPITRFDQRIRVGGMAEIAGFDLSLNPRRRETLEMITTDLYPEGGDISQVVLTGSPATLRQTADNGEPMTARAQQIVYTLSSDIIVLSGDVVIEQPRGNLRGQTIKYDLNTGRLDGGGDGNRVQMRILPKSGGSGN